jgi:hypothetical protein
MAGIPTDEKRNIEWDPVLESSSSAEGSANQRVGITVECPRASDRFSLFKTTEEITIQQIDFVLQGTTDVTAFVQFDPDRSAGGTSVINAGTVVSNTTTGQELLPVDFDNAVIPAGNWVWVFFSAITDLPDEINVSVVYS